MLPFRTTLLHIQVLSYYNLSQWNGQVEVATINVAVWCTQTAPPSLLIYPIVSHHILTGYSGSKQLDRAGSLIKLYKVCSAAAYSFGMNVRALVILFIRKLNVDSNAPYLNTIGHAHLLRSNGESTSPNYAPTFLVNEIECINGRKFRGTSLLIRLLMICVEAMSQIILLTVCISQIILQVC